MKITQPVSPDVWQEVIKQDPDAMISHTPEWINCICQTGPYVDASRLFEFTNERLVLLPAVGYKALPGVFNREKSLPHGWGIGGLTAPGGVTSDEIAAVFSHITSQPLQRISIRSNPLQASKWKLSIPPTIDAEHHITHILSLEGGFEAVWSKQFSSATRNKIRKAEKSGLAIERDTTGELFPEFYQLYLSWSERRAHERHLPVSIARLLASTREPRGKFQAVINNFGEACRLWVARLEGQVVAAAYLLVWGEHAIYWRSASDKEMTLQTRANDLLQKVMIEDACQSGCRFYHMGESGGVASLMHFKSRFGAVEYPYEEYHLGHLPLDGFFQKMRDFTQRAEHILSAPKRESIHETRTDD